MRMEPFSMAELFDFSESEEKENDEEDMRPLAKKTVRLESFIRPVGSSGLSDPGPFEEEDLEWISNKDAFPVIETFVGVLPSEHHLRLFSPENLVKNLSPVSVLESSIRSHSSVSTTATKTTIAAANSSGGSSNGIAVAPSATMRCRGGLNVPVKTRSKRRRTGRGEFRGLWTHQEHRAQRKKQTSTATVPLGRKCSHCSSENTPQWRAGPAGPKTLCNACGVRFKSGRLVPEYRPANSPTFSVELHSNSHRKVMEIRKRRQLGITSSPGQPVDKGT